MPLAYRVTPKSGPVRAMSTLLDANHGLSKDLPSRYLARPHWLAAGKLLVRAAESGGTLDVLLATEALVHALELEGWMSRPERSY
jgi:hypothetical protein